MKIVRTIALVMCTMLVCACSQTNNIERGYIIKGTAEGTEDGDSVFLCSLQGFFSFIPEDTAVVKDGRFVFEGKTECTDIRYIIPIHKGGESDLGVLDILLENADYDVKIYMPESNKDNEVVCEGPENKIWKEYKELEMKWAELQDPSWNIISEEVGTAEEIAAARAEFDSLTVEYHAAQRQFMIENIPSGVSDMLFRNFYFSTDDEEEKQTLLALYAEKSPDTYYYKKILAEIAAAKNGEVGFQYTDFSMADTKGNQQTISQYVKANQYTLVDFWASWCGPCRREMPNVVAAYEKYHDKGLEIIGVSLDNDKDAWLHGIEELGMDWPQLSDLKGWECEGAALYAVKSIPANLLIDNNGVIVAKNLRDEALHTKLAELLD